jgi:signal transduction histidine kinase
MQEIISRALEGASTTLEAKAHTLELQLPEAPVATLADPLRLTQAVLNLVNNAAKYTPPQGNIEISLASDANGIHLAVTDNGVGIAPEMLPRVFDLYMQVPMDDRPVHSGLGIGLSLVKEFVELHGGTVFAHSDGIGHGSRFEIRLPRREKAEAAGLPMETAWAASALHRNP